MATQRVLLSKLTHIHCEIILDLSNQTLNLRYPKGHSHIREARRDEAKRGAASLAMLCNTFIVGAYTHR